VNHRNSFNKEGLKRQDYKREDDNIERRESDKLSFLYHQNTNPHYCITTVLQKNSEKEKERSLRKGEKMEERRRFSRFPSQLKAQYFVQERKGGRGKCTIINTSRKGMGIIFHTAEKINEGSTVHLEVFVSTELEPINVEGVLKWIVEGENDFVGGVELIKILDDVKFAKLI